MLQQSIPSANHDAEDEDGRSLFYSDSTNMAIQVIFTVISSRLTLLLNCAHANICKIAFYY